MQIDNFQEFKEKILERFQEKLDNFENQTGEQE